MKIHDGVLELELWKAVIKQFCSFPRLLLPSVCEFTSAVDCFWASSSGWRRLQRAAHRKTFSRVQTIPETPSPLAKTIHWVATSPLPSGIMPKNVLCCSTIIGAADSLCHRLRVDLGWHFRVKRWAGSNQARHCVSRNTDTRPNISFSHPPSLLRPPTTSVVARLPSNLIICPLLYPPLGTFYPIFKYLRAILANLLGQEYFEVAYTFLMGVECIPLEAKHLATAHGAPQHPQ